MSPTSLSQVAVMLMFFGSVSNLSLLIIGDYYNYSHDKNDEKKMKTEQGYGMGFGGYNKLCPAATGLSLVTLFSLSVSIEDRPLLWVVVR